MGSFKATRTVVPLVFDCSTKPIVTKNDVKRDLFLFSLGQGQRVNVGLDAVSVR